MFVWLYIQEPCSYLSMVNETFSSLDLPITPWLRRLAISIYFLDDRLSLIFQWLYVQSTCNYYHMVNEIYICFFDQTVRCLCDYISKILAINTPWLMRLTLKFIFLITPCPMFLWLCVQDICNYYDVVNDFFSNLVWGPRRRSTPGRLSRGRLCRADWSTTPREQREAAAWRSITHTPFWRASRWRAVRWRTVRWRTVRWRKGVYFSSFSKLSGFLTQR